MANNNIITSDSDNKNYTPYEKFLYSLPVSGWKELGIAEDIIQKVNKSNKSDNYDILLDAEMMKKVNYLLEHNMSNMHWKVAELVGFLYRKYKDNSQEYKLKIYDVMEQLRNRLSDCRSDLAQSWLNDMKQTLNLIV